MQLGYDGSATFAGGVIVGGSVDASTPDPGGCKLFKTGTIVANRIGSLTPASYADCFVGRYNGTDVVNIKSDGSATFAGTITTQGGAGGPYVAIGQTITFNTGADDDDNYTVTTETYEEEEELTPYIPAVEAVYGEPPLITPAVEPVVGPLGNVLVEGTEAVYGAAPLISEAVPAVEATYQTVTKTREIRTYTGPTLDVKERLQNLISRIDAIEANEVVDDATDSSLLQLVASLTTRLDERDAQIAALTARVTTLEAS